MRSGRGPPAGPHRAFNRGSINWIGLATLYRKEIRKVVVAGAGNTAAPAVFVVLVLLVFRFAGAGRDAVWGLPVEQFIAPGLLLMTLAHGAFGHCAETILESKYDGTIVDLLMPPLGPAEVLAGLVAAAATRAFAVTAVAALVVQGLVSLAPAEPLWLLVFAVLAAAMTAALGLLAGLWAERWEHYTAVDVLAALPLIFLSGTFYSVAVLPDLAQGLVRGNPVFYLIDGFRYGVIGQSDADPWFGLAVCGAVTAAVLAWAWRLLAKGTKLKA